MPATPRGQSPLFLITSVERRLTAALAADLEREGVSVEQWRALECLDLREGTTMSDIAGRVLVPAPTLTKLVDRLVASNLVHRRGDPQDRRRVLVLLTPRGGALRQRLDVVAQHHQEWLSEVLGKTGFHQLTELVGCLHSEPLPSEPFPSASSRPPAPSLSSPTGS